MYTKAKSPDALDIIALMIIDAMDASQVVFNAIRLFLRPIATVCGLSPVYEDEKD